MNIMIAQNIKKLRKQKDITQEEIASHLGISFQAISKWERQAILKHCNRHLKIFWQKITVASITSEVRITILKDVLNHFIMTSDAIHL